MFGPEVRKYLVLNNNDSAKCFYQTEGSDAGLAKCPTNSEKNSEVSCTVKFSLQEGLISLIRVTCIGPPVLTAAGNYVVKESRGRDLNYLARCSRLDNISNILKVNKEISNSQGLWVVQNAVDEGIRYYNILNK